jgi:L-lactate dehydrogenase
MKAAIVGGGGRVGSCAAYALQWGGIVSEIILYDVLEDLVHGEALDLVHGGPLLHDQRIYTGDLETVAKADLIIITAGLRRKPEESRLDLVNRNVSLFCTILGNLKEAGLSQHAILFVVSNPVDILTHLALEQSGCLPERVLGLGTLLDTSRFCSLIADAIQAAPTQVRAMVLGEHGDSMAPIWSSATYAGLPLEGHPDLTSATKVKIFEKTRQSGAEMIKLKGGAGWAVATAIATVVHSIVLDQRKVLPVTSFQRGAYGITDVCLSVPTVVGHSGVLRHVESALWPREVQGLRSSAKVLRETLAAVRPSGLVS